MVDESHHKVNLTKPDKVILVEIYQSVCGMSVVDGDWETLKRFNLAELNKLAPKSEASPKAEALPERVTKNEALTDATPTIEPSSTNNSNIGELTTRPSA